MLRSFTLKEFRINIPAIIKSRGLEAGGSVQQYVDSEVLRLSDPFIPKDTGALINSGITSTVIGSGKVVYNTPYARRWYYMPANFQGAPQRGNYWFERMKQQYATQILEGARKRATGQ